MRIQLVVTGLIAPLLASGAGEAAAIDSITVTAYRTPQPLERAGSALTLVERADIDVHQSAVAADALRGVPGLAIARSGPAGAQTQVRMRGAEANQVLVLIDGVEANDVATDDAFSFEHLTTFDIERIEIVRGPQSALWGSDALAGVINVVTRRPEESLETAAYLEGGSFGFTNGGARVGSRSENAWVTASVSRLETDGTNAARTGPEDDGYENTSGNLIGSLRLLPGLMLEGNVRHTEATAEFDGADIVDGVLVAVDAENETDVRQNFARVGLELDSFGGRLRQELDYAVAETDTDTMSEDLFSGGFSRAATNGKKYGVYYQGSLRVREGAGERPPDQITVAVDHEREEFSQRGEASDFGDPNQDQDLHGTGYALEYLAFIGRDLSLSLSARHDDNSDFGNVNTWRTTAAWSLSSGTRLHGSFGTGQKAPTFFERFGYAPDTFTGNPDLDPETSKGWDAGVEQRLLDGRLTADATYFHADLDDEINGLYCPPPLFDCTAINETGESRRKGVETSIAFELSPSVSVNAAYTYTDARQSELTEVRRPRHAGSLDVTARAFGARLTTSIGAYYTGEREDEIYTLTGAERTTLDAYTLLNLAVSYDVTGRVTLYGRIENALDEDYEDVYGFATPGIGGVVGIRAAVGR